MFGLQCRRLVIVSTLRIAEMNRGLVRICFNFLNAAEPKKTWSFIVQLNCVTLLTIVATESGTAESQNTTAVSFQGMPQPHF